MFIIPLSLRKKLSKFINEAKILNSHFNPSSVSSFEIISYEFISSFSNHVLHNFVPHSKWPWHQQHKFTCFFQLLKIISKFIWYVFSCVHNEVHLIILNRKNYRSTNFFSEIKLSFDKMIKSFLLINYVVRWKLN